MYAQMTWAKVLRKKTILLVTEKNIVAHLIGARVHDDTDYILYKSYKSYMTFGYRGKYLKPKYVSRNKLLVN